MHLFTVVAFSVLPFFVGAVPVSLNPSPTGRPISIPLAKRSNHLREDGTIDPDKLDAGIYHTGLRLKRALDLYERNTGEPHRIASKRGQSNERRFDSSVPLTNQSNVQWTGGVSIGNPPQKFTVEFDTLVADLFVPSVNCPTCSNENLYDVKSSSTGVDQNQAVNVIFDFDTVTGEIVTDVISVGEFEAQQNFIAATFTASSFQSPNFFGNGLLGLGLSQASVLNNSESFFGNLINQNKLQDSESLFGLVLSDDVGPELILGGTDTTKFSGELTIVNMNSLGFWQIQMDSMIVDGTIVTLSTNDTIFDSTSTLISGDAVSIANIYSNIPGSSPILGSPRYSIPCDTAVTINVSYGGKQFNIPPSSYILGPISAGSPNCTGGFGVLEVGFGLNVLHMGTVLMENLYTQFDQGNLQIGLAQVMIPSS